ncbi:MAG TPA: hypothetical protein VMV10_01180 [Pirellulales bacterium]|nr:hypothetical protein [Pirellulales bacterium]
MKRNPQSSADDGNSIEHLVEKLAGVEWELAGIRQILDAIRDELAWWQKNSRSDEWTPVQPITSMPRDPTAPDWAERLNRLSSNDLTCQNAPSPAPAVPAGREGEPGFCCDTPDLQWTGDPQFPGVACRNCGYTVADCGSVVMHPAPGADPNPEPKPKEQQRALFAEEER